MNKTSIIGIDLAKHVFQLHGLDRQGRKTLGKRLQRGELLTFLANLPPTTIVIEACGGAHYWAGQFARLGHSVRMLHPAYVKPFVRVNKNDARDAEGIALAGSQASIPDVMPKREEQLDLQAIHRVRERLVKEKTAIGNELRGLLNERGALISRGDKAVREDLVQLLSQPDERLSRRFCELIWSLREEWLAKVQRIADYDRELTRMARTHEACQRLMTIPGIGPIVSTLLYCYAGNGSTFASGRHLSASLGLVPAQYSSGGKEVMQGISKRGNKYLRKQLIHGARAAYRSLSKDTESSRLGRWIGRMGDKHVNKVVVGLANKLARIAWVCLARETEYQANASV
jgi:transposase